MSLTADAQRGVFFHTKSSLSLKRADVNFHNEFFALDSPYCGLRSNLKAIGHPIFHAMQLVRDGFRLVYGAFSLIGALASLSFRSAGYHTIGMLKLVIAATIEVLNTALAIVSLATRLLASIFNLGYVSQQNLHLNGRELAEANAETTMVTLDDYCLGVIDNEISMNDDIAHKAAFTLI